MPGFVDVTGWSSEEVRRLGHADDEDDSPVRNRNPWAYRKPTPKAPTFSYEADKVWGAAVVAMRINNGYIKALAPGINAHKTNRQIVDEILSTNDEISESSMEEGRKIRQYFKALTFKVIEGKTLTPFLQNAMQIADADIITNNLGVGTISSLPATYQKMASRDDVENRIKWARGGYIAEPGSAVTEKIEIIKELWSNNYNTYYYTGINDKDQVLFFAYRTVLEIGTYVTITGKVKSHRDTSTQLSHVKVVK